MNFYKLNKIYYTNQHDKSGVKSPSGINWKIHMQCGSPKCYFRRISQKSAIFPYPCPRPAVGLLTGCTNCTTRLTEQLLEGVAVPLHRPLNRAVTGRCRCPTATSTNCDSTSYWLIKRYVVTGHMPWCSSMSSRAEALRVWYVQQGNVTPATVRVFNWKPLYVNHSIHINEWAKLLSSEWA
jgi:hypothetical protein